MMTQEMALLGEDQILFSSDFPHDEGRGDAMKEILERHDLSETQKRKSFAIIHCAFLAPRKGIFK